jgi:hypothetical protein
MRRAHLVEDGDGQDEDRLARRALPQAGVARLAQLGTERGLPEDVLQQIRAHHHMRRHVRSGSEQQPDNVGSSVLAAQLLDINREVLKAERANVLSLRDRDEIGDDTLRIIQRELDLEELVMMRKAEEV